MNHAKNSPPIQVRTPRIDGRSTRAPSTRLALARTLEVDAPAVATTERLASTDGLHAVGAPALVAGANVTRVTAPELVLPIAFLPDAIFSPDFDDPTRLSIDRATLDAPLDARTSTLVSVEETRPKR